MTKVILIKSTLKLAILSFALFMIYSFVIPTTKNNIIVTYIEIDNSVEKIFEIDSRGNLTVSEYERYFGKEKRKIYSTKIHSNFLSEIGKINFEKLDNYYYNKCILITSGIKYNLSIHKNSTIKEIHLHHYYLAEVEKLINIMNKSLPDNYQAQYLESHTKQNCE